MGLTPLSGFGRRLFVQPTVVSTFSDNFDRANEDPLDPVNWELLTTSGFTAVAAKVESNRAANSTTSYSTMLVKTSAIQVGTEQEVSWTVESATGLGSGVLLRTISTSDMRGYLGWMLNEQNFYIFRNEPTNVGTTVGAVFIPFLGYPFTITVTATTQIDTTVRFVVEYNGNEKGVVVDNDAPVNGQRLGFFLTQGCRLDDFSATILNAPPPYP